MEPEKIVSCSVTAQDTAEDTRPTIEELLEPVSSLLSFQSSYCDGRKRSVGK
jgi:hypothetical protein